MPEDDFDIPRLAEYLHFSVADVSKLAERGKLPGRKVQGQWRFSPAEIHHWLEGRIGLSDADELQHFERVLRPGYRYADQPPAIADLLSIEAIGVPLAARTRNSVISSMCQLAARTGLLWDAEKMADAVRAREDMHSTALEIGVALLHPRRPMPSILGEAILAFGRTDSPIPFGGEGLTSDLFFLICSTDDRGHLQTLARLSRILSDGELVAALRGEPDAAGILAAIKSAERLVDE
jgi:PTS system nitrogen regulatory IIA component